MISRPTLLVLRAAALQSSFPITQSTLCSAVNSTTKAHLFSSRSISTASFPQARRTFSTSRNSKAKNRIFTSVRNPSELYTYIQRSTSARIPLITLWTASYCATCKTAAPMIERLISNGAGEASPSDGDNSVMYAEVEYDSPDMMESGMGSQYMITALPTLMSFDRGEAMTETKVVDGRSLVNEQFLKEWIERESRRKGEGSGGNGGGNGGSTGFFGGLFGNSR